MNLKEAFRYQRFINNLMSGINGRALASGEALTVTKVRHKHDVNPDAEDVTEVIESEDYIDAAKYILFIEALISEKDKVTAAINKAKSVVGFDIDAAVESNKIRQQGREALGSLIRRNKPYKKVESGTDYKFNAEGNQVSYYYTVDVEAVERFNKSDVKKKMKQWITEADKVSADIDAAMVTTIVEFEPRFDVNDSFEDIIAEFE